MTDGHIDAMKIISSWPELDMTARQTFQSPLIHNYTQAGPECVKYPILSAVWLSTIIVGRIKCVYGARVPPVAIGIDQPHSFQSIHPI